MTSSSEPEWLSKPFPQRLAYAYSTGLFADVILSVPFMGEKYNFKAHKNILALHSSAFARQFYRDGKGGERLAHIHPQGLSCVLRIIYNVPNTLSSNKDKSIYLFAYHTARILGMKIIEDIMKKWIFNCSISFSNLIADEFWKLLELSHILKLEDIVQELLKYAESRTDAVLNVNSFTKASVIAVKQVLSLDNLNVSEIRVLESIDLWFRANKDVPFLDSFLEDLLMCVRFRNLSGKEFMEFKTGNQGLISEEDAMRIFIHLENPTMCTLPLWCSTKFRRPGSSFRPSKEKENSFVCEEKISVKLSTLLLQQKYTDVCFTVLKGQPHRSLIRIKAHRNILALGSHVFNRMFFGPLPDNRPVISITTEFAEGFEAMVRYFYDDSDPDSLFTSSNLAAVTFEVALKYGSNRLKNTCLEYFREDTIKTNTFWKLLEYRRNPATKTDEKLLHDYLNYATVNTKDIFEDSNFLSATKFAIIEVLKLNNLSIKEVEILENVAKWVDHDPDRSLQAKYDLLRYIRFDDITYHEFIAFLAKHKGFFEKDESFSILKSLLTGGRKSELPKWYYRGRSRNFPQNETIPASKIRSVGQYPVR